MVEYATINSMSSFQGQNQLSKVNILQAYFELIMMKFHQFHLIFIQSIKLDSLNTYITFSRLKVRQSEEQIMVSSILPKAKT